LVLPTSKMQIVLSFTFAILYQELGNFVIG
jgi:hypothetical protein